ncbi:DUF4870 family protein [Pseudidiomarina andamanensis]|uniref:DUF4870 family protein n=1 Tax=Pseudidiomarina andamanensis TaxID=1940690 RepID=UPI002874C814|nr:hypothetical protein [Pseudidiomarina andamanensis]MDS0218488.1 hypothetical protein [Pseudidiomarina andamanensis]
MSDFNHETSSINNIAAQQLAANKQYTQIIYILQLVSLIFGITSIIGVVMNYVKLSEVRGTFLESHFRWQIRTFWFVLLWTVIGGILTMVGIGVLILLAVAVWYIYRAVKGLNALSTNRPMYI